jgi:hypothetical protein
MGAEDESFKVRIPEIRDVRETLRVPVEGYGLCTAMSRGGRVIALGGMVPGQHGLIHMFDNTGKRWWHHKTREAISTVAGRACAWPGGRDTGEAADHAAYAHVLVGTLEMARLLDSPDLRVLSTELGEFAHEYTRALSRDEVKASEICDLTVLHAYLLKRNWKAVERLSELKGGPTWDHLRAALEAWRRVDLRAFQEHSRAFRQSRPDRVWWPTQTLPDVVPPANAHEALNALAPFNHVLLVHGMLDRLSNKDYLVSMVKRADGEMAAGREERAAALYENALALDTFAFLDARRIHMRLAGYMLSQRRETEAAPHLEAARAGRDAALAEFRSLRGLLPPGGRRAPPAAAKAPAAQPQGPVKNACPKCGAAIPGKAIRRFKCGKSLK